MIGFSRKSGTLIDFGNSVIEYLERIGTVDLKESVRERIKNAGRCLLMEGGFQENHEKKRNQVYLKL
jgi:hypothetical protein